MGPTIRMQQQVKKQQSMVLGRICKIVIFTFLCLSCGRYLGSKSPTEHYCLSSWREIPIFESEMRIRRSVRKKIEIVINPNEAGRVTFLLFDTVNRQYFAQVIFKNKGELICYLIDEGFKVIDSDIQNFDI